MSNVQIPSSVVDHYKRFTESAAYLAVPEGERYALLVQKVATDATNSVLHDLGHVLVTDQLIGLMWPKPPRQPRRPQDDAKVLAKIIAKRNGETVTELSGQLKQIGHDVGDKTVGDVYTRRQLDEIFRPLLTNGSGAAPTAPGTI